MPSAAKRIRRVNVGRGKRLVTRSLTPHTVGGTSSFLFILARNHADNFIIRVPMAAVRQIMGLPRDHAINQHVVDVDPQTTDYTYSGKYPDALFDAGDEETA